MELLLQRSLMKLWNVIMMFKFLTLKEDTTDTTPVDTTEVELSKAKVFPHKEPQLFDNNTERTTSNHSYADSLILLWKLQRIAHKSNQVVSYRYVGWISSIFKELDSLKTNITFLPVITKPNNRI